MFPHRKSWQMVPHPFPNPYTLYAARHNVPVTYTIYGGIIGYYRDANKDPNEIKVYSDANHENEERINTIALRSMKNNSSNSIFSMEESIEKGLTIIEDIS